MAPRLVSGGFRLRRGLATELFIRTDDAYGSDSDSDSDSDDDEPHTPTAPVPHPTTQTVVATQTVTQSTTTPGVTPPSVQAGVVDPSDPNGSLTRVSEDGMHTGGRIGVGIGVVAGVLLLFGLTYFIWGRKRKARERPEHGRSSSVDHLVDKRPEMAANNGPPDPRTNSQILDEMMATAYGNDGSAADEKRQSDYPYHKAKMRPSMASWLRRQNPLQLNSLSRWSASTTKTRSSTATSVPSNRNTTASLAQSSEDTPPVPPVPALPPMARFSERFKSVWSDTSAGTVESGSDTKSRDFGSILVGYEHSEWGGPKTEKTTDKTEKKADPDAGR
ncbi:hypothetical protein QBC34DRAFT_416443 [Podospora aff. communis PSN243]|uniref:Mid2 domain-containing protein n=1 Tax=Podospora aff. communis PSN243 TaxID=3040156 RepID=A0AAV9G9Q2_9PEZI|nr:hypothetical protein QBC34DRAFT_416443 [Podospora aff. communis PSN243]